MVGRQVAEDLWHGSFHDQNLGLSPSSSSSSVMPRTATPASLDLVLPREAEKRARPWPTSFHLSEQLPVIELEPPSRRTTAGNVWPGGDVMGQSPYRMWWLDKDMWPPEERYYKGARLGEYARPPITNENVVGFPLRAPVPLSQSEDELTLAAEASAESKTAREAAVYAVSAANKADAFYRLAMRKVKRLLRDPPLSVRPTADVFPLYSAAVPWPMLHVCTAATAAAAAAAAAAVVRPSDQQAGATGHRGDLHGFL
eukprot:CAMPEP_0206580192 /NCGR_PEP_ID=MMETSP0325_2-20121206/33004_1 /ASSEMBLY_ACC=CAM_ASM_000347 /TAXON_ID=2866 /ORGANISM="Crypthecodinium cohnii, Strain Seligo" /LENGTH=255 /DNA_ID=CAMNT_0054086159 /DNA_START=21 /DNA_END=788 /DNA_ORIENTATION=+